MNTTGERRQERRLSYNWPVWFAESSNDELAQGQMVDLSSRGASFTCYADEHCPYPGQQVMARFSIPRYARDEAFDMIDLVRSGRVCRVDGVNSSLRRIALQFSDPLPFSPGE